MINLTTSIFRTNNSSDNNSKTRAILAIGLVIAAAIAYSIYRSTKIKASIKPISKSTNSSEHIHDPHCESIRLMSEKIEKDLKTINEALEKPVGDAVLDDENLFDDDYYYLHKINFLVKQIRPGQTHDQKTSQYQRIQPDWKEPTEHDVIANRRIGIHIESFTGDECLKFPDTKDPCKYVLKIRRNVAQINTIAKHLFYEVPCNYGRSERGKEFLYAGFLNRVPFCLSKIDFLFSEFHESKKTR